MKKLVQHEAMAAGHYFALFLAVLAAIPAVFSLYGWAFPTADSDFTHALQMSSINTAVIMLLTAASMFFFAVSRIRFCLLLATFAVIVCILSSLQHFFILPWSRGLSGTPANTAFYFIIANLGIILSNRFLPSQLRISISFFSGCLAIFSGLFSIAGATFQFGITFAWGSYFATSPLTAISLLSLGAALILIVTTHADYAQFKSTLIKPTLILIIGFIFFIVLWQNLINRSYNNLREQTQEHILEYQHAVQEKMLALGHNVMQMQSRLVGLSKLDINHWHDIVSAPFSHNTNEKMISLIYKNKIVPDFTLSKNDKLQAQLPACIPATKLPESLTLTLLPEEPDYACLVTPLLYGEIYPIHMVTIIDLQTIFSSAITSEIGRHYHFDIQTQQGQKLYMSSHADDTSRTQYWQIEKPLDLLGLQLRIAMWPQKQLINSSMAFYPFFTLLAGLIISILLAVIVQLFYLSRLKMKKLETEVDYNQAQKEQLSHQSNHAKLIYDATYIVNAAQSTKQAYTGCLQLICNTFHWVAGHAFMVNTREKKMISTGYWYCNKGINIDPFCKASEVPASQTGEDIISQVFRTKKPQWITNVALRKDFPRYNAMVAAKLKSIMAFPIVIKQQVVAILEFTSANIQMPDADTIQTLYILGQQLGHVIESLQSMNQVKIAEAKKQLILNTVNEGILGVDAQGRITFDNIAAASILGYKADELLTKSIAEILFKTAAGVQIPPLEKWPVQAMLKKNKAVHKDNIFLWRKDNTKFPAFLTANPTTTDDKLIGGGVITFRDITEQNRTLHQLEHIANYDSLTQLPNRSHFITLLKKAIVQAKRSKSLLCVFYVDIDHFKSVNDTLGYDVGDKLIIQIAQVLQETMSKKDVVARMGGDDFIILSCNFKDTAAVSQGAKKILDACHHSYQFDGHELLSTVSIGITTYPEGGDNSETLMRNASIAMYYAQNQGHNNSQVFSKQLAETEKRKSLIDTQLRGALKHNEFSIVYQPIYDVKTKQIASLEALIRWDNKILGRVSPYEFIPIAEEVGLINTIGAWVLDHACAFYQTLLQSKAFDQTVKMSINFSVRQLAQVDLLKVIGDTLKKYHISENRLIVEVTETELVEHAKQADHVLHALHKMGTLIAIDDFGTGYSSLSYLKQLPISILKIDRTFITDIQQKQNDTIVQAIIQMGKTLKLEVIAEGVETQQQLDFLTQHGCQFIQGYFITKPLNGKAMQAFLKGKTPKPKIEE